MPRLSAGLLLFRRREGGIELLLVHPGGPLWKSRDEGAWSIPKGEVAEGESILDAARREFEEETGWAPEGPFSPLVPVRLASGKIIHAWAVEGDGDPGEIRSSTFELEWPPRSGIRKTFPEIDRAAWFPPDEAVRRLNPGQAPLVHEIQARLSAE